MQHEQSILTPQAVDRTALACLYREDELSDGRTPPAGASVVQGIASSFGFHPGRIAAHKAEIGGLLAELPDEFRSDKGGGWSFLNACQDRHGRLWTGEHRTVETLVCLGIAAGLARFMLPRDLWSSLPGGMPYFAVTVDDSGASRC